jgi:hypothetical protein
MLPLWLLSPVISLVEEKIVTSLKSSFMKKLTVVIVSIACLGAVSFASLSTTKSTKKETRTENSKKEVKKEKKDCMSFCPFS